MEEYYFLFGLAFVWIVFAVVQDLRTKEISNWLNFSLIAFVLAYRAFYSVFVKDVMFFVYGFLGVLLFVVLAYSFYYGRIFAGGDAKLLMGLGGIFPYQNFYDYLYIGFGFIFLLFTVGAFYSLTYSLFLVSKKRKVFAREFKKEFIKIKNWFYFAIILAVVFGVFFRFNEFGIFSLSFLIIIILPFLYAYAKAVEVACMIKLISPGKLREGDWLEKNVKVGRKVIKKSVHGLAWQDIDVLRKAKKKVWIKDGVPFTPAFLFAFVLFIYIYLRYFV
ncbi:MAG: prepilin peptidase [Nanoarchaeota archaeon]|nr:prepilin peptidase [Nanoarchaeota archaeon]